MLRLGLSILLLVGCNDPGVVQDAGPALDVGGSVDTADGPAPDTPGIDDAAPPDQQTTAPGTTGTLLLLTYNVAGLPFGLSTSDPEKHTPLISPLLNHYDLALVQEDFSFHTELASEATHAYQSDPMPMPAVGGVALMNDGLNRFSTVPFGALHREAWTQCSGVTDKRNDCLATKGFSVAQTAIAPGLLVDVYNVHLDAGSHDEDIAARAAQVKQLLATITSRSAGKAVIVAGDTNLKPAKRAGDGPTFDQLLLDGGLTDACGAVSCGDERIDRVLFRGSASVDLTAKRWEIDARFVDADGNDLSNHEPVAVLLAWTAK